MLEKGYVAGAVTAPRLLIVDDDAAMRNALRLSLETEWNIVGEAENGAKAIEACHTLRPDLVLMDVNMPVMDGFSAAKSLQKSTPHIRILFVSGHNQAGCVDEAFEAGAGDYVSKAKASRDLDTAIREVLAGRSFLSK